MPFNGECKMSHLAIPEMQELLMIWDELEAQLVGDYIDPTLPTVSFTDTEVVTPEIPTRVSKYTWERIGVCKAINTNFVGHPVDAFENIYEGESEGHYEGALEYLGAPAYLSFHDALNLRYVE